MDIYLLTKGFFIGFAVAAPIGPMAALCIQRTLDRGSLSGFLSGLGIATADAFYASVAAFGLTFISRPLLEYQKWLHLVGGIFLLYLGTLIFFSKFKEKRAVAPDQSFVGNYVSTFFLTLSNPATIFSFLALFALLGTRDNFSALCLVTGVFLGSAFWWLALSQGVSLLRRKLEFSKLRWINRVSGLVIVGFGLVGLITSFKR